MRIKLKTCLSGVNYTHKGGSIIDVSEAEAHRHVAANNAEFVDPQPIENMVSNPPRESATLPRPVPGSPLPNNIRRIEK